MAEAEVSIKRFGSDILVVVDGVVVARRGRLHTPQAGTWVSVEPGWEVLDSDEGILIRHNGVLVL
jgi:hypothetical protein